MKIKITTGKTIIEYEEETDSTSSPEITYHGAYKDGVDSNTRAEKFIKQVLELCVMARETEKQRIANECL